MSNRLEIVRESDYNETVNYFRSNWARFMGEMSDMTERRIFAYASSDYMPCVKPKNPEHEKFLASMKFRDIFGFFDEDARPLEKSSDKLIEECFGDLQRDYPKMPPEEPGWVNVSMDGEEVKKLYYKRTCRQVEQHELLVYIELNNVFNSYSLSSRINFSKVSPITPYPDGYFIEPPNAEHVHKGEDMISQCIAQLVLIFSEFDKAGIQFVHGDLNPTNYVWIPSETPEYNTTEGKYSCTQPGYINMFDLELS